MKNNTKCSISFLQSKRTGDTFQHTSLVEQNTHRQKENSTIQIRIHSYHGSSMFPSPIPLIHDPQRNFFPSLKNIHTQVQATTVDR